MPIHKYKNSSWIYRKNQTIKVKTIMPSSKDIASCILSALLDYLQTQQKISLHQTLQRQVQKCTHSITLTAHLCLYKNNSALPITVTYGAVVRIPKTKSDLHFLQKVFKCYKVEILFS